MYSDMGAMRLPHSHVPVFDLIDYLNRKNKDLTKDYRRTQGLCDNKKGIKLIEYFYKSRKVNPGQSPPTIDQLNDPANNGYGPVYLRDENKAFPATMLEICAPHITDVKDMVDKGL